MNTYLPHGPENGGLANPDVNDLETREWWAACARREYVMQQCADCGRHRYPPKPVCHNCGNLDYTWDPQPGRGTVYSYEIVDYPAHPCLADRVPYIVAIIELPGASAERVVGNILGAQPVDITIGAHVELVWEDIAPGITLPQWRLAGQVPTQ